MITNAKNVKLKKNKIHVNKIKLLIKHNKELTGFSIIIAIVVQSKSKLKIMYKKKLNIFKI
jgi:hypothetical protein